jgi:hypothetical protein
MIHRISIFLIASRRGRVMVATCRPLRRPVRVFDIVQFPLLCSCGPMIRRSVGEKLGGRRGWPTVVVWTAVCAAWLIVIWTWSALHLAMTVDDTYYYFKTAVNVGRGLGSSFDGINPTDGYHPLWLAMLALLFKPVPDDMILVTRIAFTLQIAMVWAGGLMLARLRDAGGARILWPLALVLVNPFAAKIVLCGQETALQFVLTSAALALWWALRDSPRGYRPLEWAGLALICALATLARLDTAFFCGALLAMPVVLPSDDERKAGIAARIKRTALGLAVYGGLIGAFLVYRLVVFDHLMPVSGAIKQHLDDDEVRPSPRGSRSSRSRSPAWPRSGSPRGAPGRARWRCWRRRSRARSSSRSTTSACAARCRRA